MAAKTYLARIAGRIKQIAAVVVSSGASNDGDLVALDATGKIDVSVLPAGVGQNTVSAATSEAMSAGDLVNLWNDSGTIKARKADGTSEGKEVHGFLKASYSSGATATVYLPGNVMTGLTGLTPGARQYLSTTPGALTETPLNSANNVHQMVGIASSATTVAFEPEEPVTLVNV